ncbi:DNA polymerase III subunit beta [Candidatus Albibeggiatoa sp. nov. BB20]|uniref:DNA polymerase III subunit beta n=1 Tax=Candidatus Albibeggiatoa sp. nov. BB20 TaxID=3162723 RepID=UPI00336553D4
MYFEIPRKELLNPLKTVASVVESRQTLAILSNILVKVADRHLHLTGTDAEVEISCRLPIETGLGDDHEGETTVPGRKFLDIVKTLDDANRVQVHQESEERIVLKSGTSRFTLSTLPSSDFPASPEMTGMYQFSLPKATLRDLLSQTSFAIANNDVRYYLNGICFDLQKDRLSVVATDGHRLAMAETAFDLGEAEPIKVIVPKKAVIELERMLDGGDGEEVQIYVDENHVKFVVSDALIITSKLIDGKFPDYYNVIPLNPDKIMTVEISKLKNALTQASILSNEKYRGIKLMLGENLLRVTSRNPEQEEAVVDCEVEYDDENLEIGFNVSYLQDALGAIKTKEAQLCFVDSDSSCLIKPKDVDTTKFVVMPMRL